MRERKQGFKREFLIGVLATSGTLLLEISVFILIISNSRFNEYFNTNTTQGVLGAAFGLITILLVAFGISRLNYYITRKSLILTEKIHRIEREYDLIISQINRELEEYKTKISLLNRESPEFKSFLNQYLDRIVELEAEVFKHGRLRIDKLRETFDTYQFSEE